MRENVCVQKSDCPADVRKKEMREAANLLYDLILDGNAYRVDLSEAFMHNHTGAFVEDIAIEITVIKMLDRNEYKSLYAMFLMKAEKNDMLKKLRDELIANFT